MQFPLFLLVNAMVSRYTFKQEGLFMSEFIYITLREKPQLKEKAAEWFHQKWGVPQIKK
jgi:hypothetical protein